MRQAQEAADQVKKHVELRIEVEDEEEKTSNKAND